MDSDIVKRVIDKCRKLKEIRKIKRVCFNKNEFELVAYARDRERILLSRVYLTKQRNKKLNKILTKT